VFTAAEIANLQTGLSVLGQELIQQSQDVYGFFVTKTAYAVTYNDVNKRVEIQQKLDSAVAMFGIANLMTIFEDHFPYRYWAQILSDPKVTVRLKAYRHLRYCAINGILGKRVDIHRGDFNRIMLSDLPVRGVSSYDDDYILLSILAPNYAFSFVREQWSKATVLVANI